MFDAVATGFDDALQHGPRPLPLFLDLLRRETTGAPDRTAAAPACATIGVVPMEVLQAGFWQLDPARTIAKYEAFAALEPGSAAADAFVRLEDWANAGAPLPYAAGRQLFEGFVGSDQPGAGGWSVGGTPVDPAGLACPSIAFASRTDRIVPAATTPALAARHDLSIGHVGMIVGGRARDRLWTPLAHWIETLSPPR